MDHYRAARPVDSFDEDNPGHAGAEVGSREQDAEGGNPAAAAQDAERLARFRAAIMNLPPDQRDALLLRLESGFSVEEIGTITGVGAETAKSRLRYATRKLKQVLQT